MADYDDILISLRRITRAIDLHSRHLMKEAGLTAPQLVVLHALKSDGEMSPSHLAKTVSLSQATVTSIVDRLVKADLVVRNKSDQDRRVVMLGLTPKGLEMTVNAPELLQAGFTREFAKLESWERHMLISSLQRIAELMDAENVDAAPILEAGEIDPEAPAPNTH